ncbi:MAG: NAD(P)-dependent alcohol dehydrogenase [Candidatus Bathyarchaeia archaeon]|nr:NAD(P)-dependent alcohol dehydrogenase [Candidatus Bathyarchaeota archaeon]
MRAARLLEPGKISIVDVDVPRVKGCEVLVRVGAAGVCHSDVYFRKGFFGDVSTRDLGFPIPITLGHEISGTIAEVGDEVQGFSKGDNVVVYTFVGDGICHYCRSGEEQLCINPRHIGGYVDGGYAEYVKVPHYRYLFKIKKLSHVEAAPLTCAGLTAFRAVRKAELDPSKFVLIVGAGGGLGTIAIQVAKATSQAEVIAVDIREEALEAAKKVGADIVINGRTKDVIGEIKRLTDNRGVDAVIDFVNSNATLSTYPNALAKRGKYILVGLYGGQIVYKSPIIALTEMQFIGSFVGNQADLAGVLALAEKGLVKPLITKVRKLEEINDALDDLEQGKVVGRQVLIP